MSRRRDSEIVNVGVTLLMEPELDTEPEPKVLIALTINNKYIDDLTVIKML